MYEYKIKPSLIKKLKKLKNKDVKSYSNVLAKINDIINSVDIGHYKNLRKPMQHLKRVHLNTQFVLTFQYFKDENLIEFVDYEHHDKAYL